MSATDSKSANGAEYNLVRRTWYDRVVSYGCADGGGDSACTGSGDRKDILIPDTGQDFVPYAVAS